MEINELRRVCRLVYARFGVLDHEQFDKRRGRNTRQYADMWTQACEELVPNEEWRPIVSLICQGACYYGQCEEWFKD